jgi:hypothetical protein
MVLINSNLSIIPLLRSKIGNIIFTPKLPIMKQGQFNLHLIYLIVYKINKNRRLKVKVI